MTPGFLLAGFAWTLWWNLDWRRFLKFYRINGPTYSSWLTLGFRIFFASCSIGAGIEVGRLLFQGPRSVRFYSECLLGAAAWFTVFVLMVKAAEQLNRKKNN